MGLATSSGSAARPERTPAADLLERHEAVLDGRIQARSPRPAGRHAVHVHPVSRPLHGQERVMLMTAALDGPYALMYGTPAIPVWEATLTILPPSVVDHPPCISSGCSETCRAR